MTVDFFSAKADREGVHKWLHDQLKIFWNLQACRSLEEVHREGWELCVKSDVFSKAADSDTVSTYQVSSVQLVTDKKRGF